MKQKQTLEILAKLSKQHLEFVSSATTRFKQQDELNQQLQLQIKVMNEKIQQIQVGLEELLECHAIDMNQLKEKVTLSLDKYAQYVQKQCTTEVKLGELENHLNETLHNIQEIQQNSIREGMLFYNKSVCFCVLKIFSDYSDNLIVGTDDDEEERVNSPEKKQEEDPSKLPIELIMNNRANTTPCTSIEANKCVPRKAFFIILCLELKELMDFFLCFSYFVQQKK